jgi:hypothetical protein
MSKPRRGVRLAIRITRSIGFYFDTDVRRENYSFTPLGLHRSSTSSPMANAMGFILSPLRGLDTVCSRPHTTPYRFNISCTRALNF